MHSHARQETGKQRNQAGGNGDAQMDDEAFQPKAYAVCFSVAQNLNTTKMLCRCCATHEHQINPDKCFGEMVTQRQTNLVFSE